jgi:hypothetical protein
MTVAILLTFQEDPRENEYLIIAFKNRVDFHLYTNSVFPVHHPITRDLAEIYLPHHKETRR